MSIALGVFYLIQGFNTFLAIIFNSFLAYLALFKNQNRTGSYQLIVTIYAIFEAFYAIITFVGMPVHFVSNGTWLVFNSIGLLADTQFSFLGPALFCICYQVWILLLVSHYLCRYICVCRPNLAMRIKNSDRLKYLIFGIYLFLAFFSFTCGMFFCTRLTISTNEYESVIRDYQLPHQMQPFGYILLRPKEIDGSISLIGLTTIMNHYMLVSSSFVIILMCTFCVLREVRKLKKFGSARRKKEAITQNQILISLIIQTAVPFIFCHIPSMVFLSFPFLQSDFSFGQFSLIFTWTTTAVKFIDPLIVMTFVPEYRRAAITWLGFRTPPETITTITHNQSGRSAGMSGNISVTQD